MKFLKIAGLIKMMEHTAFSGADLKHPLGLKIGPAADLNEILRFIFPAEFPPG